MSSVERSWALGDRPLFAEPKPTCNLDRPNIEKFLDYSRSFYDSGPYANAHLCRQLEQRLAQFHDVKHVIAVTSGFWAHVLAMAAAALPERREVIAPAFGYRRTDDMIAWAGYVPHFCDIDPKTLSISVDTIKPALGEQTALILAPHPMVNCCDADEIEEFGRLHGIPVVFDSVEAAYRKYHNRRIGGFGDAEAFSMHSPKLLNSFEGGYITTNDGKLAAELRRMRDVRLAGNRAVGRAAALNAHLSEMHAAMALASLDGVEEQIPAHRRKYDLYAAGLQTLEGLQLIEHKPRYRPDYRLIVVSVSEPWPLSRDETLRLLEAENVLARPYYYPLTQKTVEYPRICPPLPVTAAVAGSHIVLPSGAHVSEEDVKKIIEVLSRIGRKGSALRLRRY
jgi:dTDP-4-amino-4,6-dideoxygalactose transaminase